MAIGLGGSRPRGRRGNNEARRLPGGGLPRSGPMLGGNRSRGKMGVSGAALPGPGGAQLMRRVQAGKIDMEQAQRTMKQRQTLAKAFGKDWRTKVYGDRGYAQRTRLAARKEPDNTQVGALNKKLMERRSQMLKAAHKRLAS